MKPYAPGMQSEESRQKCRLEVEFSPRLGKWMFWIMFAIYAWLMYEFTPADAFSDGRLGEALLFYLMFLGLFTPMLYLPLMLWKNKTVLELTWEELRIRYKLPYWFGSRYLLPDEGVYFVVNPVKYTNKGIVGYFYYVQFFRGTELVNTTYFPTQEQAENVCRYLNHQLKEMRISVKQAASGQPGRASGTN